MSVAQVSALLAIWSAVGIVVEVPSGALADRFSRRAALAWSEWLRAIGYAVWMLHPTFSGFAIGFACWSVGGSLHSGTFEAVVFDGLAVAGETDRYAGLVGSLEAAQLMTQVPTGLLAAALFAIGGYPAVGWTSAGVCVLVGAWALRFEDSRPASDTGSAADGLHAELGYVATLRAGIAAAGRDAIVLRATVAVALLLGLDAIEEYFGVLVADDGTPRAWVPAVLMLMPLCGALGALLTRRARHARGRVLGALVLVAALILVLSVMSTGVAGIVTLSAFYGVYRFVLAMADARLQHHIDGAARATTTSVVALLSEVCGIGVFGLYAWGGIAAVAVGVIAVAVVVVGPLATGLDRSAGDAVEEAKGGA